MINGLTAHDQAELDLDNRFRVLAQPPNYTKLIADARLAIWRRRISPRAGLSGDTGDHNDTAENQRPNFNYLTGSIFFGLRAR